MARKTIKFRIKGSAAVGVTKRGKVVRRAANVSDGFYAGGVFHPIRSSVDYDPSRGDPDRGKKKKGAKKKTTKRRPKAKAKPKAAKRRAAVPSKKKVKRTKRGRR
jgi:hypothetical protein